jgi:polysaccharide biosynthesis transport protein
MRIPLSNAILPPTKKDYFSRFRVLLLASFPIGLLLCFLCSAVVTYVMPRLFESTAVIQLKPSADDSNMSSFFPTESEVIRSKVTLKMAAQKLDLSKRWGLPVDEVVNSLHASLDVTNIRGTDLISITTRRPSREDARDIALAVVDVYNERRRDVETELAGTELKKMEKALMVQSTLVEGKRKKLDELKSMPVLTPQTTEVEKVAAKVYLDSLTNAKNDDERLLIVTQIIKEDNIVKTANAEYLKAGQELETLANQGVKADDPRYQKQQLIVSEQYAKMMELVKTYQDSLAQKVSGAVSKNGLEPSANQAALLSATQEFETANLILHKMRERFATMRIDLKPPYFFFVFHEEPQIPQYPISPNVNLNLTLGAISGVTLFPLLVFLLTTLYHVIFPNVKTQSLPPNDIIKKKPDPYAGRVEY